MNIIKRWFTFDDDNECIIGLCKFNDELFKIQNPKEQVKKRISNDISLSELLKRNV